MSGTRNWQVDCVVDASATIKLFVVEPLSEYAAAFFLSIAALPELDLYVPDLFFGECANILWKYTRRSSYPLDKAQADLAGIKELGLRGIPTVALVDDALHLAVTHGISVYDACYVALALRLRLPLITADEALLRKLSGVNHDFRWLRDVPLTPISSP